MRPPRPTRPIVTALAVLLLAACGDDGGSRAVDTEAPTTSAVTSSTSTTTTTSTTTGADPTPTPPEVAPGPVDASWQRYEERWVVAGVAAGDVLNVRRAPGASNPVVARLAPDADDVVLFDAVERVDGSRWGPVEVSGGAGWVNLAFLRPPGSDPPAVEGTVDARVEAAADDVQAALGTADHQRLAAFADERGVVFSTDAHVDDDDPVLSAEQLAGAGDDDTVIRWGSTDGEGAPIEMAIEQRLAEIGRDHALVSTDVIAFDTRVGTGNTIDNLAERFPGASVVEYHFDGTSLYGDFDWRSVRFVFDPDGPDRATLLAVVQDTWTI